MINKIGELNGYDVYAEDAVHIITGDKEVPPYHMLVHSTKELEMLKKVCIELGYELNLGVAYNYEKV